MGHTQVPDNGAVEVETPLLGNMQVVVGVHIRCLESMMVVVVHRTVVGEVDVPRLRPSGGGDGDGDCVDTPLLKCCSGRYIYLVDERLVFGHYIKWQFIQTRCNGKLINLIKKKKSY